jgi:hypothetical protein
MTEPLGIVTLKIAQLKRQLIILKQQQLLSRAITLGQYEDKTVLIILKQQQLLSRAYPTLLASLEQQESLVQAELKQLYRRREILKHSTIN